jgi:hypothetical protein
MNLQTGYDLKIKAAALEKDLVSILEIEWDYALAS